MKKQIRILIVEDEAIIANDIKRTLEKFGYIITDIAKSGETALQMVKESTPDLVLVDILLEGSLNGIDITQTIQREYNVPVIFVTAFSDPNTVNKAKLTAPYGYVSKPFEDNELFSSIEMALHKFKLDKIQKDVKNKIEKLHSVAIKLGACESRNCVFKEIEKAIKDIFNISKFAFYMRERDHLILQTKKYLKIFKTRYEIAEGIVGKIFSSEDVCIYSLKNEFSDIEPEWDQVGSIIGCGIGDRDVFLAVSNNEMAFSNELAEMLNILFKHTNEALKRLEYENLLKKKAVIDPLTNVYNRLYYIQAIKYEVKLAKRYNNNIGIIVVDINGLKKINDEYGHSMGDKALEFIASMIVSQVRDSDIIIRIGGDEFLLLLPQTGKEVEIIEKRLKKAIIEQNKKSKLPFPVNFAIGSAFWNTNKNMIIEDIIKEADNKMYTDKRKTAKKKG